MKKCPFCENLISETAIRCKFCRKVLSKVQVKETEFHKVFREIIVPKIFKPVTLVLSIVISSLFTLLLIAILINQKREELVVWIKNLSIWGWIGSFFIIGCILFLFNTLVHRRKYFEEDLKDICFCSGASIEYVGERGRLDIEENITFTPYNESMKPVTILLEDIVKVRTERDLKEEPAFFTLSTFASANRRTLSALGSARRRNYLFILYRRDAGEKMMIFETHRKSRQSKILKDKIEEKLKTEE